MPHLSRGILVAIEGIDGSGKSTLTKNLTQMLSEHNFGVIRTQEPGKTDLGKLIKPVVQNKQVSLCSKAEFLLFAADRAQHFHEIVLPSLEKKMIVISDRMADSSLVYQGFGRGLDLPTLNRTNTWAMENKNPDIVIYVKVSPKIAFERIQKRGEKLSSFEQEKEHFIKKLCEGFDTLFASRKDVITIDGNLDEDALTHTATHHILDWLTHNSIYEQ